MKCFALFITAFLFSCRLFAQGSPCTANTSRCLSAVRSGVCASWTAAGNGIVDPPDPACADAPGPAFDGQYWLKYTPSAGVVNISVKVDITALGGGTNPLLDAAFQLYSQPAASDDCANGPFTLVDCYNDAAAGVDEVVRISGISDANVYYIRIFEVGRIMDCAGGGQHDDFILCVSETGENACAARVISSVSPFFTFSGNTTGYLNNNTTDCYGKVNMADAAGLDYWFVYTSPGDEYVKLRLKGTTAANVTELKVSRKGASCDVTSFPCYGEPSVDESDVNGTWGGGIQAAAGNTDALTRTVYLEFADDYYFIVDAQGASTAGPFVIDIVSYTPSGDEFCLNAETISSSPVSVSINDSIYTAEPISGVQPGVEPHNMLRATPLDANGCDAIQTENTKWMKITSDGAEDIVITVSGLTCTNIDPGFGTAGMQLVTMHNPSFDGACGGADPYWIKDGGCRNLETADFSYTPVTAPPAGRIYFIMIDGAAGSHCIFDISLTGIVLPIELLYFRGEIKNEKIILGWATASEINNDYFTVERSNDAKNYKPVGTIKGAGNSSVMLNYSFEDNPPVNSAEDYILYYRLKQTDYDGGYSYSETVAVEYYEEKFYTQLYPNPAGDFMELNLFSKRNEEDFDIMVYSLQGARIHSEKLNVKKGANKFKIHLNAISPGLYFLLISSAGETKFFKVSKK